MPSPLTTLIYGLTGQTLDFYPPDAELIQEGVPAAAATYDIWRATQSLDDTPVLTGTATLDAVSTTISTASGYSQTDRRRVRLTSVASMVVLRRYFLESASSQREIFVTRSVDASAVEATAGNDLAYDYAAGAAVKGIRHAFTIDATFIQTLSNINLGVATIPGAHNLTAPWPLGAPPPYRVRWTYSIGGRTRHHWTTFDVARRRFRFDISIEDLRQVAPDISDFEWEEQRGRQFAPQIQAAEDQFLADVELAGFAPDSVEPSRIVNEIFRACVYWKCAEAGWTPAGWTTPDWVHRKESAYRASFQQAIGVGRNIWVSLGTSGGISPDPPRQRRLIR